MSQKTDAYCVDWIEAILELRRRMSAKLKDNPISLVGIDRLPPISAVPVGGTAEVPAAVAQARYFFGDGNRERLVNEFRCC